MEIEYINIWDKLKEKGIHSLPDLGIFRTNGNVIKVMQWQPKGEILFSESNGFKCTSLGHKEKCIDFLKSAWSEGSSIVLTPEYSTPFTVLIDILNRKINGPKVGKVWCLGMEGISCTNMKKFLSNNYDNVIFISQDIDEIDENNFLSCIMYLFRAERELVCVTQFKTTSASDRWAEFESLGLTYGNVIYYFSDKKKNVLFSLICADALNQGIIVRKDELFYHQCIILHPQLNPNPIHDSFDLMRHNFFDYSGDKTRIISANWAKGTYLKNRDEIAIKKSYSGMYFNKNLKQEELTRLMKKNKPKGMHLTKKGHIFIWHTHDTEHSIMYSIDSYDTNNINIATASHKEPIVNKFLEYDDNQNKWIDKAACDLCPIDWIWLQELFGLQKCGSNDCSVTKLFDFFSILFCRMLQYEQLHDNNFFNNIDKNEEVVRLRERSKNIVDEIKNKNIPEKFHKLNNGNYKWLFSERGNLCIEGKEIICVSYVDVSDESIIKRKIIDLKEMIGEDVLDRLLLYYFSGKEIKYYDKFYNININNPELNNQLNLIK